MNTAQPLPVQAWDQSIRQSLEQLSGHYGIEVHRGYNGGEAASKETLVRILSAMGVRVDTPDAVTEELQKTQTAASHNLSDPVVVTPASSGEHQIPCFVAENLAGELLHWVVEHEDGRKDEGGIDLHHAQPAQCPPGEGLRCFTINVQAQLEPGYHKLHLTLGPPARSIDYQTALIAVPDRCFLPPGLEEQAKAWGFGCQLYSLRSHHGWGIGDFSALDTLIDVCAHFGAGFCGVNPLHALPIRNPKHVSPYSPVSRTAVNFIYLDIEKIPDFQESEKAQRMFAADRELINNVRGRPLVDYPDVSPLKLRFLEALYENFRRVHLAKSTERAQKFREFIEKGGELLERYALFEALDEQFNSGKNGPWGWPTWPAEYHDRRSQAVAAFARERRIRVDFYKYIQWQTIRQLKEVGSRSMARHLPVGLYFDLALGSERSGAEVWADPELYARDIGIGAPPDPINPEGQNWGLPPMVPQVLKQRAYQPFIEMLRYNMHYAGALRMDHVMGLMQLFWIPSGMSARDATYVRYPFNDLLGIIALESHRNQCMVIGEDLGMVPEEVHSGMRRVGMFSYTLLFFAKDGNDFMRPASYQPEAIATPTTHDLPTLKAFWEAKDVDLRRDLGFFKSDDEYYQQRDTREQEKEALTNLLKAEGLLPGDFDVQSVHGSSLTHDLFLALVRFFTHAPSKLVLFQIEDVLGQLRQINVPGVVDAYPCWQHRLRIPVEDFFNDQRFREVAEAVKTV